MTNSDDMVSFFCERVQGDEPVEEPALSELVDEAIAKFGVDRVQACQALVQAVELEHENRQVRYVRENLWMELVEMAIERTPGVTKDTLMFEVLRGVGWLDEANHAVKAPRNIVAEAERRLIAKLTKIAA